MGARTRAEGDGVLAVLLTVLAVVPRPIWCIKGSRYAHVLPLPVRAMETMSLPSRTMGQEYACTGVGAVNPHSTKKDLRDSSKGADLKSKQGLGGVYSPPATTFTFPLGSAVACICFFMAVFEPSLEPFRFSFAA